MGVIYKFKWEVIDFILRQKGENPDLSCRRLAQMVNQQFQMRVSKSSVNTILKNAQLSSPVGRRSLGEKKEPFAPSQMQEEVAPKPIIHAEILPFPSAKKARRVVKKVSSKTDDHVSSVISREISTMALPHDGMGCIFLKAVEWGLSPTPILGELLKDYVKGFSLEDIDAASEVLLYLNGFGLHDVDDLAQYQGTGLWKLNQLSSHFDYRIVTRFYKSLHNFDELGLRMAMEIDQLFTQVKALKIFCEDGQEIFLDAGFFRINNVQSDKTYYLQGNVLSNLTEQVISNRRPTLIKYAPGQTALSKEFHDFVACYENRAGKKIIGVSIIDAEGQELSKFASIPEQKRYFVIGLWPWQKEFDMFLGHRVEKTQKELLHPLSQQKITLLEIEPGIVEDLTRHLSPAIRGCLINGGIGGNPIVTLLTNIPASQMSTEAVARSYLLRWPSIGQKEQNSPLKALKENISTHSYSYGYDSYATGFGEQIAFLLRRLEQTCYHQFFSHWMGDRNDTTVEISIYYKLSGYWQDQKDYFLVTLISSSLSSAERKTLEYAIMRLNESNVRDPSGRQVFVEMTEGK